ncbi:MAG: hypothetical protein D6731_11570 [Planctomycetota bacterium]|nr:MAG: hypothetical protein D6731_11570 [Planctomycetota bacterium]
MGALFELLGEVEHDGELAGAVEPPGGAGEGGGSEPCRREGPPAPGDRQVAHPGDGARPGAHRGRGEEEGAQGDGEGAPLEAAVDHRRQGEARGEGEVGPQQAAHEARPHVPGEEARVGELPRPRPRHEQAVVDVEVGGEQAVEELLEALPLAGRGHHGELLEEEGQAEVGKARDLGERALAPHRSPIQGPVGAAVASQEPLGGDLGAARRRRAPVEAAVAVQVGEGRGEEAQGQVDLQFGLGAGGGLEGVDVAGPEPRGEVHAGPLDGRDLRQPHAVEVVGAHHRLARPRAGDVEQRGGREGAQDAIAQPVVLDAADQEEAVAPGVSGGVQVDARVEAATA